MNKFVRFSFNFVFLGEFFCLFSFLFSLVFWFCEGLGSFVCVRVYVCVVVLIRWWELVSGCLFFYYFYYVRLWRREVNEIRFLFFRRFSFL